MVKVFYKGEEIDVKDLYLEWHDHFGQPCSGDLDDYRGSEVDDALCEYEASEGW